MPDWDFSAVEEYAKRTRTPPPTPQAPITTTTDSGGLASSLYDMLTQVGPAYRTHVAEPVTQAVEGGLGLLPFAGGPGTEAALHGIAQTLVPQSTTSLGILAGGLATGGASLPMALAGPTVGGLVGGAMENAPGRGAATGLAAGVIGETVGRGLGVLRRYAGQQSADEARIGQALESITPALRNQGTAASLNRQVAEGAQPDLSAALEAGLQQINSAVGGQATFQSAAIKAAFPDASDTMTFLDAAKYIRLLGAKGWSRASGNVTGGVGGAMARDLRSEAIDEITAQLPSNLASMWKRVTSEYGQGKILLDLLQEPNVLYPSKPGPPGFPGLGVPALQAKAAQYYTEGDLAKRLTPDQLRTLEGALQRGGTFAEGTDYSRAMLPFRLYAGPVDIGRMSESFHIPLPKHYVGTPLSVPTLPFTGLAGNALGSSYGHYGLDLLNAVNPYRR